MSDFNYKAPFGSSGSGYGRGGDHRLSAGRFDDWYWYTGRSERTGYTTGHRSRLGWESEIKGTDKSYSSIFWRPTISKDKAELISRAYNLAKDMILVMDTPTRVGIKILDDSLSDVAFTDGKVVFVSTNVFDDTKIQESEAVDIFCGSTIHEGCHLLYSKMKPLENWIRTHEELGTEDLEFRKYINNVLEDERIESELAKNKPGLIVFLEKMKDYYLSNAESSFITPESGLSVYEKTIDVLFRIIRYPKNLTQEHLEVNPEFFNKVQDLIVPLPESTEETLKVADAVCDLLISTLMDEKIPEAPDKKTLQKKLNALADFNNSGGGSRSLKKFLSNLGGMPMSVSSDSGYNPGVINKSRVSVAVSQNKGVLGKILEGTYEYGASNETIFVKNDKGWGNTYERSNYIKERDQIREFIPSIKKILMSNNKNYTGVLHGCKTGTLDTTKLAEAYQGVEHVYFKNYKVKTKNTSICILIDESGSMGGNREVSARKAAILLNEAFKDLPNVNLYIYGHSGDQLRIYSDKSTDIYVYREPGQQRRDFVLANSHARWENRDGVALREVAKRIRTKFHDQNEVLMFVISDGEPSANDYRGSSAIEDTRQAVLELEKMRFIPVSISIDAWYNPSRMYKNYIELTDLNSLAQELGKVVKKAVLKASTQDEMIL